MLRINLSNRYEALEAALLARLADVPSSPFAAERIVVPSAAMRRKVELAIADRHGICANVEFPFLAQWLWTEIGALVPVAEKSPFAPEVLAWRVYAILGDASFAAAHAPLQRYLQAADEPMRYELACRVATLIELYITYRPQWLEQWSQDRVVPLPDDAAREHERWQAALWRRIAQDLDAGQRHPSLEFFAAIDAGKIPPAYARRVHVFCVPAMPPVYLDIVRGLARFCDVDLYALDPSQQYWFDVVDAKRLSWLASRGRDAHHETAHRLLAAWGAPTQAFLAQIFDDRGEAVVDEFHFERVPGDTLLATLQNSILDLADPPPASVALAPDDRSIEIHVCHSRMRELEVLHDRLLALFAADRSLSAADVLVVTPDLAATAPLVDAVFGNAPAARRIPYAVTGRPQSVENPIAGALLAALELASTRFPASEAFALLQRPPVARRFGLDDAALASIHRWIRVGGIRWGLDARDRSERDLPSEARFTFDDGLNRLFAGYAFPSGTATPFDGRLAAGDAEGLAALALGAFAKLVAELTHLRSVTARRQGPAQWFTALRDVLATFVEPSRDDAEAMREVEMALAALRDDMVRGGLDAPLPLSIVHAALSATIDSPTRGGMPTGVVTFASMASLRAIPFRVVCAIGLDDNAFPARAPRNEFDLMLAAPARGDRQRRLDDRNVLLDLLLAARDVVHLSYVGRSVRDNAPLPPAAPLAELLDYLGTSLAGDAAAARARLVVAHPLQPFSPEAFDAAEPRRQSFDTHYADALRDRYRGERVPIVRAAPGDEADDVADDEDIEIPRLVDAQSRFFPSPLPRADGDWRVVTVERLLRFYRNPSRYLLSERLAIAIPEALEELDDDEPFGRDWRTHWTITDRLLGQLRGGASAAEMRASARAGVEYPPGPLGDVMIDRELAQLMAFAAAVAADSAAPPLPPQAVSQIMEIEGDEWRLDGALPGVRTNGLVLERYVNVNPRDYMDAWIRHLILNALRPAGVEPQTVWHSRDGTFRLRALDGDAARTQLRRLVALYAQGLATPLPFFPRSSWAYVVNERKLNYARSDWNSNPKYAGESAEPAIALAFRGVADPLDAEFEATADGVFGGIMGCLEDARL
jgi:exodeoxyribonuclease V gamma subunit